MKTLFQISTFVFLSFFISGCSTFEAMGISTNGAKEGKQKNPLKTLTDRKIEKLLTSGKWQYERQYDDCKDTNWVQNFYKNRYYKSIGAACLVPHAFSVTAENWHLKNQILYITNLSPLDGEDIIIKYGIHYLDQNRLILSSGAYKYTFEKVKH